MNWDWEEEELGVNMCFSRIANEIVIHDISQFCI